jgi:hypothetical protein
MLFSIDINDLATKIWKRVKVENQSMAILLFAVINGTINSNRG